MELWNIVGLAYTEPAFCVIAGLNACYNNKMACPVIRGLYTNYVGHRGILGSTVRFLGFLTGLSAFSDSTPLYDVCCVRVYSDGELQCNGI